MKLVALWLALAIAIFFALIVQEFVPPVQLFRGARIILVPMLFCYGALIMPLWGMLLLAIYTGLLSDLMYMNASGGHVEIALGWSIVVFVLFGLLAQGFQPGFLRGQWWVHIILSAVFTFGYLALQYAMICFRRQELVLTETVFVRILGSAFFAAVVSPLVHFAAVQLSQFIPGDSYFDGDFRQHER